MSFSINPSHNFLVDTPVIIEEQPNNSQSSTTTVQVNNQTTTESKNDSNILSKGIPSNGGLQVHQVAGALDDFY